MLQKILKYWNSPRNIMWGSFRKSLAYPIKLILQDVDYFVFHQIYLFYFMWIAIIPRKDRGMLHLSQSWVLHEHARLICSIQGLDTASCISVALILRLCGKNRGNLTWVLILWTLSSINKRCTFGVPLWDPGRPACLFLLFNWSLSWSTLSQIRCGWR